MGMNIQHNMGAINAHRNMGVAGLKNAKAMEKLSTGFRINRAADDAAGLAISEKMRSQVRGLNQASRNANDGISLIQTAEGALSTTHEALQRMQTLATEAASGTYKEEDKKKAQDEVDNLKSEIDRIADTTEFNGMKLLNGDLNDGKGGLVTTAAASGTVINATKAGFKGAEGRYSPIVGTASMLTTGGAVSSAGLTVDMVSQENFSVSIDGVSFGGSLSTATNFAELKAAASALSDGTAGGAIKLNTFITELEKAMNDVLKKAGAPSDKSISLGIDGKGRITMTSGDKNSEIHLSSTTNLLDTLGIDPANDPTRTPAGTAFAESNMTVNKGLKLTINGKETMVSMAGVSNLSAGDSSASFIAQLKMALIDAVSTAMVDQNLTDGDEGFINARQLDVTVDAKSGKLAIFFAEKKLDLQFSGSFADQFGLKGSMNTLGGNDYPGKGMTLHVGANENQIINFGIGDMHSEAIGLKDIDLTKGSTAEKALTTIQSAINVVSDQRAKLGAVQNRLEYTITNLDTTSENLQASESQIRDADMASEVMNQTQSNVLQQAAQAMLAQSNQKPQSVLQLLG